MTGGTGLAARRGKNLPLSGEALGALLSDVIGKGVPFRFRAKGFSMSPFVKDGDILTVSPLAGREPRMGDVIAFRHPETGRVAVHRVVGKRAGTMILKGDNSPEGDGPLPSGTALGIVTTVERAGQRVRLGLGPSGAAVAGISRAGLLTPFLGWVRRTVRIGRRKG